MSLRTLLIIFLTALTAVIIFFSFPIRHALGKKYLETYPLAIEMIENNRTIRSSLEGRPIETAPTLDILWAKLTGKLPPYLMTVEVKAAGGKEEETKKEIKGTARMSLFPESDGNSRMSCTLSWTFNGKTNDFFNVYDPNPKENDQFPVGI